MAIMIDPVTGQGTQMGGIVNPGGGVPDFQNQYNQGVASGLTFTPDPGVTGFFLGSNGSHYSPEYMEAAKNNTLNTTFGQGYGQVQPGGSTPGMGGKGSPGFEQIFNQIGPVLGEAANTLGGTADPALIGQGFGQIGRYADTALGGSTPGMGGKGGPGGSTPGAGGKGSDPFTGVINQIPNIADQIVAQQPSLAMPGGLQNLPQPPAALPAAVAQGGTPGRPVPVAPMTPRGPGLANPGASGVARSLQGAQQQQQQMYAPHGPQNMTQAIQQQAQAVGLNRGPVARPGVPAPINRPLTGNFQPTMPQRRGAGRGGMLR